MPSTEFLSPGWGGMVDPVPQFSSGDRVRVTEGRYKGNLGTVRSDTAVGFFVKFDYSVGWVAEPGRHECEPVDVITELGGLVR